MLDDAIGGIQSAAFAGGSALYQLYTDGFTKKAVLDWAEQQKGYMQFRFDDLSYDNAADLKASANILEKTIKEGNLTPTAGDSLENIPPMVMAPTDNRNQSVTTMDTVNMPIRSKAQEPTALMLAYAKNFSSATGLA